MIVAYLVINAVEKYVWSQVFRGFKVLLCYFHTVIAPMQEQVIVENFDLQKSFEVVLFNHPHQPSCSMPYDKEYQRNRTSERFSTECDVKIPLIAVEFH